MSWASSLPPGPGAAGLFSAKSNLKTANTAGTVCPPSAVNFPFVRKISTGEGGSSPSQLQAKAGRTGSFNRPLCARLSHLPTGSLPPWPPFPWSLLCTSTFFMSTACQPAGNHLFGVPTDFLGAPLRRTCLCNDPFLLVTCLFRLSLGHLIDRPRAQHLRGWRKVLFFPSCFFSPKYL